MRVSYIALSVGPMGRDVATMIIHLSPIGYFHRIKGGRNSLSSMTKLQLAINGFRREMGPPARKPPFSLDDLRALNGLLYLNDLS